ncbi:toll-like receptor 2 isoform X3 [Petromyzon marinus]|uniref:toll-like receptor 2 isoform X3 n=1 Tax=Petromyzon marinus TaxID=7757 RepID=UPI003F6EF05F
MDFCVLQETEGAAQRAARASTAAAAGASPLPCWPGGWGSAMDMGVTLLVTFVLMAGPAWSHGDYIFSGCQIRGDRADCSHLGLHSVPEYLPVTIASLDMSYNQISSIQREHLSALSHLKSLNVAFNQILSIDSLAFSNNSALEDIDLSNNRLPGAWDDSFALLKSVRYLDVSNNSYIYLDIPGSFTLLKTLHHLKVGGLNVTKIQQSISETMELEHLSIVTGDLSIYTPGSLSAFRSLQSVTLALILRTNISLLTGIICDVSGNSVELQLDFLDFTNYSGDVNPFECVSKQHSILEIFNVSHLQVTIPTIVFLFTSIIRSNKLVAVNMRHIYFNGLSAFPWKILPSANISVRHLLIEGIYNPNFHGIFYVKNINALSSNLESLVVTDASLISLGCDIVNNFGNLYLLDISNNKLNENSVCGKIHSANLDKLNKLILRKNIFTSLDTVGAMLKNLLSLTSLDVSENRLRKNGESGCEWPLSLKFLNVSRNFLKGNAFNCLPTSLHSLDMSNNKIQNIDFKLMKFEKLKELYLSNNKLSTFPVELPKALPWLKVLTIAGNTLLTMDPSVLHGLGNFTLLDMRGNPFYCTCDIRHFITFCENSSPLRIEGWPADYQCSNPEDAIGKQLSSLSFPTLYCHTTLKIVIACVTTFVCTALLVGLCWYLDALWYVRMMWAWLQAKRRNFLSDSDENAVYDAFVSYSQYDAIWVMEKLLPELESHSVPPFRLCVHERDFVPGRVIMDNIIDCIEQSRKTLFVISRSFVESEWCHYELYFAQQRLMESRDGALVLVLLEPIPRDSVPSRFCRLRRLMARKTYLEWPVEQSKQALFWANLRATLSCQREQEPQNLEIVVQCVPA